MHIKCIWINSALHHIFPKPPSCIDKYHIPKATLCIDTKHHAATALIASNHLHNNHREIYFERIEIVGIFVTDAAICEVGCKAHLIRPK